MCDCYVCVCVREVKELNEWVLYVYVKGKSKFLCERFVFMCKCIVSVCMYFVCICECFYCLPIFFRIDIKILVLVCKCLLKNKFTKCIPARSGRSSSFYCWLQTTPKQSGGPLGKFVLNRFLYKRFYKLHQLLWIFCFYWFHHLI